MEMYNPPHPGRILKEDLESIPVTVSDFAAHIGVSRVGWMAQAAPVMSTISRASLSGSACTSPTR